MNNFLKKVEEFHIKFGHPVKPIPTIAERGVLRYNLIKEEATELLEGIKGNNLLEIADALADLQYVLAGAILEFGLGEQFDAIFNEVHRSNMSKACKDLEEVEKTKDFYKARDNMTEADFQVVQRNGSYIVLRNDGKMLKSINYSKADITQFLYE